MAFHDIFATPINLLICQLFQGPLLKVCHGEDEALAVRGAECEGRAVSFLYNAVSKDSILVTAWSGGQLQIDALADEIQPVWITGSAPCLRVDLAFYCDWLINHLIKLFGWGIHLPC